MVSCQHPETLAELFAYTHCRSVGVGACGEPYGYGGRAVGIIEQFACEFDGNYNILTVGIGVQREYSCREYSPLAIGVYGQQCAEPRSAPGHQSLDGVGQCGHYTEVIGYSLPGYGLHHIAEMEFVTSLRDHAFDRDHAIVCRIHPPQRGDLLPSAVFEQGVVFQNVRDMLHTFDGEQTLARQFVLPSLILLVASVLDYINYALRITQLLSLFYMTGTLIFTFMLGVIGMRYTRTIMKEAEAAKRKEQTTAAENASLVKYNQMKADWIATVSHETKTPLAVLSGYAELIAGELRKKGVDEQTACDLDNIAEEAQRVAGLMDELQRHISKQSDMLQKTRLNLPALIDSASRLYTPILARKRNQLAVHLIGELTDVYASAGEITQVLFNLLHNSHTYTENGEVTIAASREKDVVTVTISDTGTGIAPELMPHVFERGISGREGGSGLGLAICKEIIDDHGGEITIANRDDGGAIVRFTLSVWSEENDG